MKLKKPKFTLIEAIILMVVLLVLGLLFIPVLSMRRESSRKIACVGNLKNIGLSMRMYSNVFYEEYPNLNGRSGLELLASEGFLENTNVFKCPSTEDVIKTTEHIHSNASYAYAGGINESSSVDSAIATDRAHNHRRYGNILFVDGHVKGYAGKDWVKNAASHLTDF